MWFNKKIMITLGIGVILSYGFNLFFHYETNLKEPIIRKVKGEIYDSRNILPIKYIENKQSTDFFGNTVFKSEYDSISNIAVPQIGVNNSVITSNSVASNERYDIKEVSNFIVEDNENLIDNLRDKEYTITECILNKETDNEKTVNLGEINLKFNEEKFNRGEFTSQAEASYDEDGIYKNVVIKSDCYLKNISSAFIEELLKKGDLYINHKNLKEVKLPIYFKKDDVLNIRYNFKESNTDFVNAIVTDIVIELEDDKLHNETIYFRADTSREDLSYKNIVKMKGEANENI